MVNKKEAYLIRMEMLDLIGEDMILNALRQFSQRSKALIIETKRWRKEILMPLLNLLIRCLQTKEMANFKRYLQLITVTLWHRLRLVMSSLCSRGSVINAKLLKSHWAITAQHVEDVLQEWIITAHGLITALAFTTRSTSFFSWSTYFWVVDMLSCWCACKSTAA